MNGILAIDATIAKPPFSGVQKAVLAEAEAIRALCPDCHVYGFEPSCDKKPPAFAHSVTGRILWQQLRLPKLLKSSNASALFAPGYTCPLHTDVPVILQVHDIIALEHPEYCSSLNVMHMRTLLPQSIRKAHHIVVSTNHVRQRLIALFPDAADKTSVIPLGVDFERFAAKPLHPNRFAKPYILFLGNIEPKKGLDVLLDAYERIADRIDENLVIAGRIAWKSGRIVSRIRKMTRGGRVIMAGRIPEAELPSLYGNAGAFVFPSIEEGFGMPVLEAMAAGTPVIHSDHPAVSEAANNAGLPFQCGNADSLANQIYNLLHSKELYKELSRKGTAHARQSTWQRFAKSLLNL
ncbi:MAG: glycosyltransferase family 4 protein [Victivallales bacterium]|nr:glycosyltransferase family 4 protein [Victivallales bacterium]